MKAAIIITIVLVVLGIYWFRSKSKVYDEALTDFVLLESNTESTDYLPLVDKEWLRNTEFKYLNKEWQSYPNEHTDQSEKLCNDVYRDWKGKISHSEFLNKLTKEQRMYFSLINFEAQTKNGGVYQFLFNYPELAIITLEAMKVAKLDRLTDDYENVLNEFFGKFDTIQGLKNRFRDDNKKWDKRWDSFIEGYRELPTAEKIKGYYYDKEYQKEYQSAIVKFVKDNASGLMKTE